MTQPGATRIPQTAAVSAKQNLIGLSLPEFEAFVKNLGEPSFRARQIHSWIYVHTVRDFEAMTNLAKPLRHKLAEHCKVGTLTIAEKQVSQDGTQKYLFQLEDGQKVESVLIPYGFHSPSSVTELEKKGLKHSCAQGAKKSSDASAGNFLVPFEERGTYAVCLSTQVGCAVNCDFCATGKLGFKRHLRADEIVEQLLYIKHDSGIDVRNIVLMGQGEPLLNYDEVLRSVRLINQSAEIGMRHITLSTSGIIPAIDKLADEKLQLTLAVSLHAPNNTVREKFMPINKKYPIEQLMPSLKNYIEKTGRRITIEYILLDGVNDSPELALELNALLRDIKCLINLIPYNPIGEQYGYKRPSRERVAAFRRIVERGPHAVTVRLERGADIAAACGQLSNQHQA